MNLRERLANIQREFESGDTPPEIIEVLNADVDRLLAENVTDNALQVGQVASLDVQVFADAGAVPLSSFLGERFLVVTWFRGNW